MALQLLLVSNDDDNDVDICVEVECAKLCAWTLLSNFDKSDDAILGISIISANERQLLAYRLEDHV